MRYYGLTTLNEQRWCRNFTQHRFTNSGEIVELGPWMGSLTIPLVTGLLKRETFTPDKYIYVYDQWKWLEWMQNNHGNDFKLKIGDSFFDEFKRRLGWLANYVIIRNDILEVKQFEHDIELLIIDAMKSWQLVGPILTKFYSRLIPHKSYVFHQDFQYKGCPWLIMIQYHLREYFQVSEVMTEAAATVFLNIRKIDDIYLNREYKVSDFSYAEITEAFRYAKTVSSKTNWPEIDKSEQLIIKEREKCSA